MEDPLAETRQERLICKHFNLSYLDLLYDLDLFEFWILLAEALDAEELADYNQVALTAIGFHNPKQLKRWRWQSPDRAGTRSVVYNPLNSLAGFAAGVTGGLNPSGSGLEFARATGRPLAYLDDEGNLYDQSGNPTEKTALTFVIKIKSKDEIIH